MPEEINRLVTDAIADYLLTPSPDGDDNLRNEGVSEERIVQAFGNVMIDSLLNNINKSKSSQYTKNWAFGERYAVLTPSP